MSWSLIKSGILSAASASINSPRLQRRPWLTNDTLSIADLKRAARLAGNVPEWRRLKGIFKARAKADLESWCARIASEVEEAISKNETNPAFRPIRKLCSPHTRSKRTTTINKLDGSPCNTEEEISERWREHYEAALNFPAAQSCPGLDQAASSASECSFLNINPPSYDEVSLAIRKLKSG